MGLIAAVAVGRRVVQAEVVAQIPVALQHGFAPLPGGQIGQQLGVRLHRGLQQIEVPAVLVFQKVPQGCELLHRGVFRALPGEGAGVTDGVNGVGHGVEVSDPGGVPGLGAAQGFDALPQNGLQQIHLGQDFLVEFLRILAADINKFLIGQRHK